MSNMLGQRSFKRSHLSTNSGDESDYSYEHTNDMTQFTQMTQTNPCVQEFHFETPLVGKYIKLKQINNGNENILMYQIQSITSPHIIKKGDDDDDDIPDLIQESTNQFLLLNDYTQCQEHTKTQTTNFCIAITVILIQIMSYLFLAYYLWYSKLIDMEQREANCFGPNCHWKETKCMDIITGLVMALLLIGFLLADFISTCSLIKDCITKQGFKLKGQLVGSIFILIELFSAVICGILVGLDSESKFDAINGAVGILFVHDLDEKIHQAMYIIESNWKRLVVLVLWIVISVVIAMSMACVYQTDFWFGGGNFCTVDEFMCSDGDCIWRGFLCNGVENCAGGDDEFVIQSLNMECDYSLIECPDNMFVCERNGECIENYKRCNGFADCVGGTDEGRHSNCSRVIANIDCGEQSFKCNNGQCIDRQFHCDTVVDCVDGTDEYPNFYSLNKWPYLKECPYDQRIKCSQDEVLCKKDGHCISKTRICDKVIDCHPNGEDERFCFYHWDDFTEFKCGQKIANISKIDENIGRIILFEKETIYEYNNLSHFWWIYENIIYPNNSWILEIGKIIPLHWRCDGIMDCQDGSDEQLCKLFPCADDEYQCNSTGHCIVEWWQCDGVPDCDFSHTWLFGSDDETGDKCTQRQDYSDDRKIECNQMFTQQISEFSDTRFYEGRATMDSIDLFFITIPCNKYETVAITTCTNHTKTFNTFVTFRKEVDHSISAMSRAYTNDDAGDNCAFNYFASTITLDQSALELICDEEHVIEVRAKYLKQSFGDYGLEVICS